MINKLKTKVVLLPTEQPSRLSLALNGLMVHSQFEKTFQENKKDDFFNQQLYLISDNPIKYGDYVYCSLINQVFICQATITDTMSKVEATTDRTLHFKPDNNDGHPSHSIDRDFNIPQIPDTFVYNFMKAYYKDEIIKEAEIELNHPHDDAKIDWESQTFTLTAKTDANNKISVDPILQE